MSSLYTTPSVSTDLIESEAIQIQGPKIDWQLAPTNTLIIRLTNDRRISEEARAHFRIEAHGNGWKYPAAGGMRWKNYNSGATPKYAWIPDKPEGAEFYHGSDLVSAIQAANGACWLASGEPDVWALRSAGIAHALSGFGESHVSKSIVEYLSRLGVTDLFIAPDLDTTGERWAGKIAAALAGSPIKLHCHRLPDDLGEHGDIGKAWIKFSGSRFEHELLELPRYYPEPEVKTTPTRGAAFTPGSWSTIPEDFRRAIIDRLGVQGFKSNGFSNKPIVCPFHDDRNPSASLHQEKGLYCHAEDHWYKWNDLGTQLGLGTIKDWRARAETIPAARVITLTTELREELIKRKLTAPARLLDGLYALGWPPGTDFSILEVTQALEGVISAWTVRAALEPKTTGDKKSGSFYVFFHPLILQQGTMEKNHKNPGGRPGKRYKLPWPGEVAEALGVKMGAHSDPISLEKISKLGDYVAEVYAAHPRREPGNYARKVLADRLGRTPRTTINYDKRANLKVTPRYERELLTTARMEEIEAGELKSKKRNYWIENGEVYTVKEPDKPYIKLPLSVKRRAGKPKRWAADMRGIALALAGSPTGEIWLVTQLSNHYQGGTQ